MLLLLSLSEIRQRQLSSAGKCFSSDSPSCFLQENKVKLSVRQKSNDVVGRLLVVADPSARGA